MKKILLAAVIGLCSQVYAENLRMLTSYGLTSLYTNQIAAQFIKDLEGSDADIQVQLSGPEVIPPFEQVEPVSAGVFDLLHTHGAYHTGVTGVGAAIDAIRVDSEKLRDSGIWAYIDDQYGTLGLKLVAVVPLGSKGFEYVLKEPISGSPAFSGRKLRVSPTYINVTKGLGGSPVIMSSGEVYSSMEKGVIDGAAWGLNGVEEMKWNEVAKYITRPAFGQTYNLILMNKSRFESLSEAQQQAILDAGQHLETSLVPVLDELAGQEVEKLQSLGMQVTEFDEADAARLDKLVNEGIWQLGIDKSPDAVKTMREMAEKAQLTAVSE